MEIHSKNIKKIIFISLLLIVFVILMYGWNYYDKYHIKPSEENVKTFIEEFSGNKVKVLNFEQIEDTNIWLYQLEFKEVKFGHAKFQKGWNNNFKFIYLKTNPTITYEEYNTNKGKYGVIFVNNLDENISKIKVTSQLKNFQTEINTSVSKTFIKTFKLPNNVENTSPATFELYDKNENLYNN